MEGENDVDRPKPGYAVFSVEYIFGIAIDMG